MDHDPEYEYAGMQEPAKMLMMSGTIAAVARQAINNWRLRVAGFATRL
jgi:hypothetical protein